MCRGIKLLIFCGLFSFIAIFEGNSQVQRSVAGVDNQCKKRQYYGACYDWLPQQQYKKNPDRCRNLKCAMRIDKRPYLILTPTGPAEDGTICGDSSICSGGSCVPVDPRNIPVNEGSGDRWFCQPSTY